jgi:sulfite exporter TauE/SafE
MGIGTSLLLIAVGAILRFAVTATTSSVNIHTVGLILMIVGAIGLLISLFWVLAWSERRRTVPPPDDGYAREPYPGQGY